MNIKLVVRFSALIAVSLVLWRTPVAQTISRAAEDQTCTHIFLILPISIFFFVAERKKLNSSSTSRGILTGSIFLVLALGIHLIAVRSTVLSPDVRLMSSVIALVTWWLASFLLIFGWKAFRDFLFPLCFLFWIVPLPHAFLDHVIHFLQEYSALGVAWLFQAFRIPVLRDGFVLSIPGLTIEVAKECSSIRSSLILLVSSMVLAQLFLRTKWRKALIIFLAVPLSVAKNVLRIFTLSMLGIHVNRGFLTGRLHHQGGVVFYAAILVVIFFLVYLLQRQELTRTVPSKTAVAAAE